MLLLFVLQTRAAVDKARQQVRCVLLCFGCCGASGQNYDVKLDST
jgi:hypothetical protein